MNPDPQRLNPQELPLVIVTHPVPPAWLASLENRCRLVSGTQARPGFAAELRPYLGQAEGIFSLLTAPITEEILDAAPSLRVVSNMAVGVDNIDVPACTRRGIPVGNTPGVLTEGTADLTMALLLAAARRLPEASQDARLGRWTTWTPDGWLGADLKGATLGIVGLGKIGRAVAERAMGFQMRIVYYDPTPPLELTEPLGWRSLPFEELLEVSDFVSLHAPLTPETKGLINEASLKKMKKSAILINAARGPIVDTDALLRAFQEGWIAAAALDVTDPEPLPPEHPLYKLPNCLVLPHIGSATQGTRRKMAQLACDNLLAGLEGRPLPNSVNPQVYPQP